MLDVAAHWVCQGKLLQAIAIFRGDRSLYIAILKYYDAFAAFQQRIEGAGLWNLGH